MLLRSRFSFFFILHNTHHPHAHSAALMTLSHDAQTIKLLTEPQTSFGRFFRRTHEGVVILFSEYYAFRSKSAMDKKTRAFQWNRSQNYIPPRRRRTKWSVASLVML